jgi:hypothetical protein
MTFTAPKRLIRTGTLAAFSLTTSHGKKEGSLKLRLNAEQTVRLRVPTALVNTLLGMKKDSTVKVAIDKIEGQPAMLTRIEHLRATQCA